MSVKHVYPIQLNDVKATLLNCDDRLILVDTGENDVDAERILSFARNNLGLPLEKHGEVCIITHRHIDHIGGLKRIKDSCNLKIISHINEVKDIELATGLKVDIKLKHRDTLPYCGDIQFIHVPGHTAGNICLYLPKKKLLIVGDTLFADEEGNLAPPPDHYCEDPDMARNELRRLQTLEFDSMILSHGKDTLKNAKKKVERLLTGF
jgi:glyoxylase-like metal-dependent hydrolase (beta-lactamase superfamily II)